MGKLLIKRKSVLGILGDKSAIWPWDVWVDGRRVDTLLNAGSMVAIDRPESFVCILRCENDIYGEISEIRIPVAEDQIKQRAYIYKKVLFGYDFKEVAWDGQFSR